MSKKTDLVKNTLIIAVGKLSTQFLSLLLLPLYTAYLSTAGYGAVDLINTYVLLVAPLLTIQIEMAAFRFLIDSRGDMVRTRRVVTNTLQIAIFGVLIAAALYILVNQFIVVPYGLLALGMIVVSIFSGFFMQIARGFGDNKKFALAGITAGIVGIMMNIVFIVCLGMGAEGVLLAGIIANIAAAIYLFISLKLHLYIRLGLGDWSLKKKLIGYSAPLVPNGISWWVINAADRTIVTIILGVASNGIYAIAYKFPMIFNSLFSFFGMSWTESASMHIDSPDRNKFFSQTMNMSIKLFGSLGLAIIVAVPFIFGLLINDNFSQAADYIPVLILGAFCNSIVGLYSALYIAKKLTKQVMNTSLVAAGVSIFLTLLLINRIGLFAPAVAMVLAYLSMAIFRHYDMAKYITITYDKRIFFILGLLYTFVFVVYYLNNPVLDIVNAVVTVAALAFYNKSVIKMLIKKLSQRKKLTADQTAAESIQESSEFETRV